MISYNPSIPIERQDAETVESVEAHRPGSLLCTTERQQRDPAPNKTEDKDRLLMFSSIGHLHIAHTCSHKCQIKAGDVSRRQSAFLANPKSWFKSLAPYKLYLVALLS